MSAECGRGQRPGRQLQPAEERRNNARCGEAADCGSWTAVEQLDNTLRLEAAEAAQGHVTSTSASSPEIEAWARLHEDD